MSLGAGVYSVSKAGQCSSMRVGTLGAAPTRHCHTQLFSRIRNHQFLQKTPYWGRHTALKRHASNNAIWEDTLWRTASKQLRKNKTPCNCSGENCKPALVPGYIRSHVFENYGEYNWPGECSLPYLINAISNPGFLGYSPSCTFDIIFQMLQRCSIFGLNKLVMKNRPCDLYFFYR